VAARATSVTALPHGTGGNQQAAAFAFATSKVQRPVSRGGLVRRGDLIDRLDGAISVPVVLVVAPPGYGKTTLLAQWAESTRQRVAWVSADTGDNDPAALLWAFAAALDRIEPVDPTPYHTLGARGLGVLAARRLAATLNAMQEPVSIVLDHLESVTAAASRDVVTELALRMPSDCQLVLASRDEVPLPTARLRANGNLLELGIDDLAMGADEAPELLAAAGVDLPGTDVESLVERTEGWPTGLYLAALAIRAGSQRRDVGFTFSGDDRFMADYLRAELLDRVSPDDVSFMTRTAVLDAMCGPLCDAVLGTKGSATVLERLGARNLLVVPLDRQRRWYRYHHLFRELLAAELSRREPDRIELLHRNAAAWGRANGLPEMAMTHAQAAGAGDEVARLILELAQPVWASGRVETVVRWMEWLERLGLVDQHPAVAVHGALVFAMLGRAGTAERWAAAAESPAAPPGPGTQLPDGNTLAGTRRYLSALLARDGVERMIDDARTGLAGLSPASPYRATMVFTEGVAHAINGDPDRADPILARAYEVARSAGATPLAAVILAERGMIAADRGNWDDAIEMAGRALELIGDGRFDDYWTSALVYAWAARAALHSGDGARARECLTRAVRLRPLLTYALPVVSLQALLEMAGAYIALADPVGARTVLRQATDILQQRPDLGVLAAVTHGLGRRLETMRGEMVGASSFTTAELRLVPFLPTHLSFREIGERLFVSRHTVKTQAISIYRKLGVSSRAEAIERLEVLGMH
jgi:LuxR family maltose regulon positive regulatory protein